VNGEELLFELPGGGRAIFTARESGNLSSTQGDSSELAAQAREALRTRIGAQRLARARQVHGSSVHLWEAESTPPDHSELVGDGHATAIPSLGLTVLTADCMPVALGSPGAVAMLHAGWRGLAGGVLERGVAALEEVARTGEIVAILGPCAGVCCYEVGPEVHAAFGLNDGAGRNLDLRTIARERLLAAGVGEIVDVDTCTICDERFFSHRREGTRAGRQGGVAWLS
jgi:YfiH family protein